MATTASVQKPAYRVPLVSETRSEPRNGLRVISTFSGAGGGCYGFEMAGYEPRLACEFVESAADSYRANHPGVEVLTRDIRDLSGADLLAAAGLAEGEVDVLEGSPPCQPFSTAGRGAKLWKNTADEGGRRGREDLFFDFARLVTELRPRAFVAENVSGLVRGAAKGYFKLIHAALVECGYRVEARMLDAQWLGVPQVRRRVIFVGVREDLGLDPAFPDPLPYRYSMRDALPHFDGGAVESVEIDSKGMEGKRTFSPDEPLGTVRAGGGGHQLGYRVIQRKVKTKEVVGDDVGASLEGYAVGEEWDKLRPGGQSERFFSLVRPDPDEPLPTVTAQGVGGVENLGAPGGVASVTHPTEKRKFSISELRRLCGFPDDYELVGSYAQRWSCLGNAVPPPMMFHVARTLADRVLLA